MADTLGSYPGETIFDRFPEAKLQEICDFFYHLRKMYYQSWYPYIGDGIVNHWASLSDEETVRRSWWELGTDEEGEPYEEYETDEEHLGPFVLDEVRGMCCFDDPARVIYTAYSYYIDETSDGLFGVVYNTEQISIYDGFFEGRPSTWLDFQIGSVHEIVPFISWSYRDWLDASFDELDQIEVLSLKDWRRCWRAYRYDDRKKQFEGFYDRLAE